MPEVIFTHPSIPNDLLVSVKPDQVTWSYGLNTASFPTYGGEVVQLLSIYFDDMTVQGTIRSYDELETIYGWFVQYMHLATQGTQGKGFDTTPVTFKYPHRGWTFKITPKSLPGFKIGRDVVAPTWQMQAAIVQPDDQFTQLLMDEKSFDAIAHDEGFDPFGKATADIGYAEDNPFSEITQEAFKAGDTRMALHALGDFYNNLIPAWASGDFTNLSANYSRPAFLKSQTAINDQNTGTPKAKKIARKTPNPYGNQLDPRWGDSNASGG